MRLLICPGVHDSALTESFLSALLGEMGVYPAGQAPLIFPTQTYPAYSGFHVLQFLDQQLSAEDADRRPRPPLLIVAFSAGVAAAIGTAWSWQLWGGQVRGLIAVDGWGVPLAGNFPIHRVSHDFFTHWSSDLLGKGEDSFYAEPGVEHLDLWRSPQTAIGWHISPNPAKPSVSTTAARFIATLIQQYSSA
jgi:hypothetical protein